MDRVYVLRGYRGNFATFEQTFYDFGYMIEKSNALLKQGFVVFYDTKWEVSDEHS